LICMKRSSCYEGNKVRIGRWEFKDQVVMKERLLGVFHDPKNGVEMGVDMYEGEKERGCYE